MSLGINLGAQHLGPNSWTYFSPIFVGQIPEKTESLRGGASQKSARGRGGLQAPRQGVWGAGSPPRNCRGSGGRQPPSKNNFMDPEPGPNSWFFTHIRRSDSWKYFSPIFVSLIMVYLSQIYRESIVNPWWMYRGHVPDASSFSSLKN